MSNPNSALGDWIFRELGINSSTIVINRDLILSGTDSVCLTQENPNRFRIDVIKKKMPLRL